MKKFLVWFILIFMMLQPGCRINRPGVGGFYMNDPGGFDSLPSLIAHGKVINEVYPLWYHVKPDGSLREEPNFKSNCEGQRNEN